MDVSTTYPKIHYPDGFDERAAEEMQMKGWISATVELEEGRLCELWFIDSMRLQQEINHSFSSNQKYYADRDMIVIPEITVEGVREAVVGLQRDGYFAFKL